MDFNEYIVQASGLTHRQIAIKSGLQPSKLSRQLSGQNSLSMETVRDIARGTGLDMLDLLCKSGHITEIEMLKLRRAANLSTATDEEITDEVMRRMKRGATYYDEHSPFDVQDDFDLAAKESTEPKGEPEPFE